MHTEKAKRKTKPKVAIIKSKGIKKEPKTDFNKESLCHLIDDRVKLIRQIFQTLKSKTIKSIAPDFLQVFWNIYLYIYIFSVIDFIFTKDCTTESLQEYCLDEILGISNKRLVSIIQATKCPTDTEDSDSDVEKIEGNSSFSG